MRTLRTLPVIAVLVAFAAACGETQPEPTPPPPAATAGGLEGYSQGVKDYYAGVELGSTASVEEEYHQPPQPAEAALDSAFAQQQESSFIVDPLTHTSDDSPAAVQLYRTAVQITALPPRIHERPGVAVERRNPCEQLLQYGYQHGCAIERTTGQIDQRRGGGPQSLRSMG